MLTMCPKISTGGRITSRGVIMGRYYRDADHLYEIYGHFLGRVLKDEKLKRFASQKDEKAIDRIIGLSLELERVGSIKELTAII